MISGFSLLNYLLCIYFGAIQLFIYSAIDSFSILGDASSYVAANVLIFVYIILLFTREIIIIY